MTDDRLFDVSGMPEVPLFREPRRRGAARGTAQDARFLNDYPPEWTKCTACEGYGKTWGELLDPQARWSPARPAVGPVMAVWTLGGEPSAVGSAFSGRVLRGTELTLLVDESIVRDVLKDARNAGDPLGFRRRDTLCPDCLGMGSIVARVRLEAGHRCERCHHPYVPQRDAKMLGIEATGMIECPDCDGWGRITDPDAESSRCKCGGRGRIWTPWSPCDDECTHGGEIRIRRADTGEQYALGSMYRGETVQYGRRKLAAETLPYPWVAEGEWLILTVHHLDGDKANLSWWNLAALCQRCHLEIQGKVVMERVYPFEHTEWFKPHAAGYYASVYLCKTCGLEHGHAMSNHRGEAGKPLPLSIGSINEHGFFPHPFEPGCELTREETVARLEELLWLERQA